MRKKIIFAATVLVALLALYYIVNSSFIDISVKGGSGDFTYTILNQHNNKATVIKSRSAHLSKRVATGNYEVTVTQGSTNYFSVVKTGRLFSKTKVTAKLAPESSRTFVGDNPGGCMNYIAKRLITYSCGAPFSSINIHMPADSSLPTYVVSNSSTNIQGYTQGIISTPGGTITLIFTPATQASKAGYFLYRLGKSLGWDKIAYLSKLDPKATYQITPYRQGFLVYDTSAKNIYYYSSINAKSQTITVNPPAGDYQSAYLNTNGNQIVTSYAAKSTTYIRLWQQQKTTSYKLSGQYTSISLCGQTELCALNTDKKMDVYRLDKGKTVYLYEVNGVRAMGRTNQGFILANATGVLALDVANRQGHFVYSLDGYKLNNMVAEPYGALLNLSDGNGQKVALLVNEASNDKDSIDKKVAALKKLSQVARLSIYGNYIYISTNAGPLTYSSRNGYGHDPAIAQQNEQVIKRKINELGINTNTYHVIFFGQI